MQLNTNTHVFDPKPATHTQMYTHVHSVIDKSRLKKSGTPGLKT